MKTTKTKMDFKIKGRKAYLSFRTFGKTRYVRFSEGKIFVTTLVDKDLEN